jgi:hypothetical protein
MTTPSMHASAAAALAALSFLAPAVTQHWRADGPDARQGPSCCYDPVRRVTVTFGGCGFDPASIDDYRKTWEWNGCGWAQRATAIAPPGRRAGAFAYDPVRGVCLLFGGWTPTALLADTWQWDGVQWTQLSPANSPPAAVECFLAPDRLRGRLVLAPSSGTTWEWNGTNWLQAGGANPGGPLAWDPVRGKVAAFSGNVHWEWNGTSWSQLGITPVPSRYGHGLAFDTVNQRLCVFGGVVAGNYVNDLWVGSGTAWQQLPAAPGLRGRYMHGCAFDEHRGRLVVTGGRADPRLLAETWEHDGTQWIAAGDAPEPSYAHALAADPASGRMLMYEGRTLTSAQTFERVGGSWLRRSPTIVPSMRNAGLAFDPVRGTFVLFGGGAGTVSTAAFHEWVANDWQPLPGSTPPARAGHAMALDVARNRIVVFGGSGASLLDDTWEWNGTAWTQLMPAVRPPGRFLAGFAFDPSRGQLLLYGGGVGYLSLGDTWYWNGAVWTQGPPGPGVRENFAMALDPIAARIVVHGGRANTVSGNTYLTDTREWNGTTWTMLPGGSSLSTQTAMAFDGQHLVLFGGFPAGTAQDPMATTLRLRRTAATASSYGTGCSGGGGVPALQVSNLPYVGDAAFSLTLSNVLPDTHTWVAASDSAAAAPFGGCTLWIGAPLGFLYAVSSRAGVARHALAIPYALPLVGVSFHWQGFAWDPAGPALGLSWSQGLSTNLGN